MNIHTPGFLPLRHRVSLETTIGHLSECFICIAGYLQHLFAFLSGWSSGSSRPVSAAPLSTYDDPSDNRPVTFTNSFTILIFSASPPIVSVEIEQWDGTAWGAADLPYVCSIYFWNSLTPVRSSSIEPDVSLVDEALDMDARLGWDFKPSNIKWLDSDVSSEVVEFPQGIKLTEKNKIYAFHRVTGCPSQFPFSPQRTGFLINLTGVTNMNPDREVTVDQLIRDQVVSFHSIAMCH